MSKFAQLIKTLLIRNTLALESNVVSYISACSPERPLGTIYKSSARKSLRLKLAPFVDHTDARKEDRRCVGRSDRSARLVVIFLPRSAPAAGGILTGRTTGGRSRPRGVQAAR